jgi:excinuclease ABC subunit C
MTSQDLQKKSLPDVPGVYFFLGPSKPGAQDKKILYIGKATSLRDRTRSYFSKDLMTTRGQFICDMVFLATDIEWRETDSVLEALLLEASLIRRHMPKYNTMGKDDKSSNYVVFTNEDFPQVLLIRGRTILKQHDPKEFKYIFGPFPHGQMLREGMKIIRRIFPYRDSKCIPAEYWIAQGKPQKIRPCFNRQIGLCPGVCTGEISKREYARQIEHLRLFFEGKKSTLLKMLEKEMKAYAKTQEFERAEKIKRTIFSLNHIQDVSLIKQDIKSEIDHPDSKRPFRIEAYDVAHISGTSVVGVMTVVEGGEINKNEYRKFRIRRNPGVNDPAALREMLTRRLRHPEWPLPHLIVVDGNSIQKNAAQEVLDGHKIVIPIVAVVKNDRHQPDHFLGDQELAQNLKREIVLANSEAHRFAITYHKKLRSRNMFTGGD